MRILERWGCLVPSNEPFPYKAILNPSEENFIGEDPVVLMKVSQEKLLKMVQWAQEKELCRINQIYKYFGFADHSDCMKCDNCKSKIVLDSKC